MRKPLTFYDLPTNARTLVYHHLGFAGCDIDLNFQNLKIYAQDTYPNEENTKKVLCFRECGRYITRHENRQTREEYWEGDWGADERPQHPVAQCYRGAPHNHTMIRDLLDGRFGSWNECPELHAFFWERNRFRICRSSPGSFKPLLRMPTADLRNLGHLFIRLDGGPPDRIHCRGAGWQRLNELLPLNHHSQHGKHAIKQWEGIIRKLANSIRPGHLTLYLIANVSDFKTAEMLVAPLMWLPKLEECAIWLNRKPMLELNILLEDTIQRITEPKSSHSITPFRYLDLPTEIRWRILEYSDLVYRGDLEWKVPMSQLGRITKHYCSCKYAYRWSTDNVGSYDYSSRKALHTRNCTPVYHSSKQLQSISDGIPHGSTSPIHCPYHPYDDERYPNVGHCQKGASEFCECIFKCDHTAISSSYIPKRRKGAHSLFLVSKKVRQDAIPVFFRHNQFLVTPPATGPAYIIGQIPDMLRLNQTIIPMPRTELSYFFSMLPRNALQHIRRLEWLLPQSFNYIRAPKAAYFDYLDTIELMAHALSLSRVTLVLNFRVYPDYDFWWHDRFRREDGAVWPHRRPEDSAFYDRILLPLRRLEGLKDFFVYLKRVWMGGPQYHYRTYSRDIALYDRDEMKYEKLVMGEDYDSRSRGKPWTTRYEEKLRPHDPDQYWIDGYGDYTRHIRS